MVKSDIKKKVLEALENVKKAKAKQTENESRWKTYEERKQEISLAVQAYQAELEVINKDQPTLREEMISLNVAITKSEGFLETIESVIDGNLEDFIK